MDKIIVSGATGYIGSNLTRSLIKEGNQVYIIVRESSRLDLIKDIKNDITVYIDDGDIKSLINFFNKIKPNLVYHLASLIISDHNYNDIDGLIDSNVKFGTRILEAMTSANVMKLVNVGTFWQHYDNEPYNPTCLYAATKEAFEKIIEYYTSAIGLSAITLELFDTYGCNDNRKKIIDLLFKSSKEKTELKMSKGEQYLDLVYIDDVVRGFLKAKEILYKENSSCHRKYSISSNERYSLRDIANIIEDITNSELPIEWGARPYRNREVMSPSTLTPILPGWSAEVKLKQGLKKCYNNTYEI